MPPKGSKAQNAKIKNFVDLQRYKKEVSLSEITFEKRKKEVEELKIKIENEEEKIRQLKVQLIEKLRGSLSKNKAC